MSGSTRLLLALGIASAYCVCLFVHAVPPWIGWLDKIGDHAQAVVLHAVRWALSRLDAPDDSRELVDGAYLGTTTVVVPWLLMAMLRRGHPKDLGVRLPNRFGWRLLFVSFALSMPFLWWMSGSPDIARHYVPRFERAGASTFLVYFAATMLGEHFLFHGVLLATFRPAMRWPAAPADVRSPIGGRWRALRWLGFGQARGPLDGFAKIRGWLGLAPDCGLAILSSGTLFGVVHLSKDPRELLLSVPGGMYLAYLSYRSNSFVIPLFLHLATAGATFAMMIPGP